MLDKTFRKATRCDSGQCLEAAHRGGLVLVRDSKWERGPVLAFEPHDWVALLSDLPERL